MWQFTRGYPNISQPDFGILMKSDYKIVSVGGFSPPLWKMMEFVSWDDDIPNWMGR